MFDATSLATVRAVYRGSLHGGHAFFQDVSSDFGDTTLCTSGHLSACTVDRSTASASEIYRGRMSSRISRRFLKVQACNDRAFDGECDDNTPLASVKETE